jgi:hypothetical protein
MNSASSDSLIPVAFVMSAQLDTDGLQIEAVGRESFCGMGISTWS